MKIRDAKAFVTGGSGGLGAVIARTLAEYGADVAISYAGNREAAELVARDIEDIGRKSLIVQMDQVKPISIDTAVDAVTSAFGGLDILVNNAAWNKAVPFADLDALTPELWDRMLHTNLRGPTL